MTSIDLDSSKIIYQSENDQFVLIQSTNTCSFTNIEVKYRTDNLSYL